MPLQQVDSKLIDPNPWQPRILINPARIAELAESITLHGLQQTPKARLVGKRYQLVFGHRRLKAWQLAFPGQPMPLDVGDFSDRQMAELAAVENGQRDDLTPIEKGQGIKLLMDEFKLTQVDAGKPYGLTSQGAVSNLLRLLKLPADVQALVASGDLAEVDARRLIPLIKFNVGAVSNIAQGAAKAPPAERSEKIGDGISILLRRAPSLYNPDWKLEWPASPLPVENVSTAKGEPKEVPACKGCEFLFEQREQRSCLRPPCFAAKEKLWRAHSAVEASKRLKIPLAAPDEQVKVIFDGTKYDFAARDKARQLVQAKLPELRIVAFDKTGHTSGDWDRKDVLGTQHAALAATNAAEIERWLNGKKSSESKSKPDKPLSAEKAEALKAVRRDERGKKNRAKHDTLWLFNTQADYVAPKITASGPALKMLYDLARQEYRVSWAHAGLHDITDALEENIEKANGNADALMRKAVVFHVLAHQGVVDNYNGNVGEYDFEHAVETVETALKEHFDTKPAPNWNKPPVHETEFNCRHCGKFATNPKGDGELSKVELAAGWGKLMQGAKTLDVWCPDCKDIGAERAAKIRATKETTKKPAPKATKKK